ncbi:hypothetical protein OIE66_04560 [Nonomuraea sp. NBC_01738]|uniref:hypothetical protein n=1 Tax=Nonomuraea sp. NBC_01738 TaxID=2976003 RepID=UPI002E0E24B4|nr:hypothetical protein OIE66_04560 [Nonomuraea sp. NBC_01738]
MRLSVSPTTPRKILTVVLGGIFLTVFGFVVVVASLAFSGNYAAGVVFGALMVFILITFLSVVLEQFRTRADLDGTVLRVRGAYTTRSIDLATARVWVGQRRMRNRRWSFFLTATGAGLRPINLRLVTARGGTLPRAELEALAAAIGPGQAAQALNGL